MYSFNRQEFVNRLIPLAARSNVLVCDCSLSGFTSSISAGVMDVSRECCVLSGSGLYDGPIPRPEDSY